MNNRTVTLTLAFLVLGIFISYFSALSILFPRGEPIESALHSIISHSEHGEWAEVEKDFAIIEKNWVKAQHILPINYAEADFSHFLEYLARLKVSIQQKDSSEIGINAMVISELWNNFLKPIPLP